MKVYRALLYGSRHRGIYKTLRRAVEIAIEKCPDLDDMWYFQETDLEKETEDEVAKERYLTNSNQKDMFGEPILKFKPLEEIK